MSETPSATYEEYTVYVDSGATDEAFREFCSAHAAHVEFSWKDTHDV